MCCTLRVVGPFEVLDGGEWAASLLWLILVERLVERPKSWSGLPPYRAQNEVEAVKVRRTYRLERQPTSGLVGTRNTVQRVGGNLNPANPWDGDMPGGSVCRPPCGPPPPT